MRGLRRFLVVGLCALSSLSLVLLLSSHPALAAGRYGRVVIPPGNWLLDASFESLVPGPFVPNAPVPDGTWSFVDFGLFGHTASVVRHDRDALDGDQYVMLVRAGVIGPAFLAQRATALTTPLYSGSPGRYHAGMWVRPASATPASPLILLVQDSNGIEYDLLVGVDGSVTEFLPPAYEPDVQPGGIVLHADVWSQIAFREGFEITASFVFLSLAAGTADGYAVSTWHIDAPWLAATPMPRGVRTTTGQRRARQEWHMDDIAGVLAPFDELTRDGDERIVPRGLADEPARDDLLHGWFPRAERPPEPPR